MPLSEPAPGRNMIHTRAMECASYSREDGLWDIEGHLTDVKGYPFANKFRGEIAAGEPLHDMWIRLTVDADFVVHGVEAATDAGPFAICPTINAAFKRLEGLRIGPGWNRRVRERVGGVKGCTHLVDLLRPLATVAYHTVRWSASAPGVIKPQRAAPPLNTCHAWASDGQVVKEEFPELYTGE